MIAMMRIVGWLCCVPEALLSVSRGVIGVFQVSRKESLYDIISDCCGVRDIESMAKAHRWRSVEAVRSSL
jgi:NADH:ubiquinone oxidoreductase subunit D